MNLVIEYHYADGDVGVYPYPDAAENLWDGFDKQGSFPSHIIVRQDNDQGQILSSALYDAINHERSPK